MNKKFKAFYSKTSQNDPIGKSARQGHAVCTGNFMLYRWKE